MTVSDFGDQSLFPHTPAPLYSGRTSQLRYTPATEYLGADVFRILIAEYKGEGERFFRTLVISGACNGRP